MPDHILLTHIRNRISLSLEEFERCLLFFSPKNIRKKQFLLQEGEISRHLAFVSSGCLRGYTVDRRGEEHVVQFAVEDWWITDLQSFLRKTPSSQNIDALEDSQVLLIDFEGREKLLEAVPKLERFFRMLLEANYVASHRRIEESLAESAEERYLTFLNMYPALAQRIPQSQIASYLGITPQSLSRIRKEMSENK